jgi:subtilisin family serine protease
MLKLRVSVWLVAAAAALAVFPATAAQAGLNKNKLTHPETILSPYEQGESFVRVIVNLHPPYEILAKTNWQAEKSRSVLREEIRGRQEQVFATLTQNDFLLRHRLENIPSFSAEVSLTGLQTLSNDPRVESIEPVFQLEAHLAQGIDLMNAFATRSTYNGQGIAIAICDTGIDYNHPLLGGGGFPNAKVIGGFDFGDNDANPIPNGQAHGTACAGIAAGDAATVGDYIGGVADGAKLYALKISYGTSGSASSDDMAAAWDWCISHQYDDPDNPIMVISTSFGGGRYFSPCDGDDTAMTTAANNAVAAGMTLLVSSGNDGYCDSIGWPACISHVISVGAVYDASFGTYQPCISGDSCAPKTASAGCTTGYYATDLTAADNVTSYSNTASFLNVLAPSNRAYTLDISGATGYSTGDYTSTFGGTSAACPYAAGAVAILQSASKAATGGYFTPDEIRNLLTSTGDDITDSKVAITKPRINVANAMGLFTESPPVASDVNEISLLDAPVTITLNATDEGLPNPPNALSYLIAARPNHGYLTDSNGVVINTVPYMLTGNEVIYTPRPGCGAPARFTYIANDGGAAPDGGDSNEAVVTVGFEAAEVLYSADMTANPGWTLDDPWDWGAPAEDPATLAIGYNLAGNYAQIASTQWAQTPAIDCTEKTDVMLTFDRWLNVDSPTAPPQGDHAYIDVSNDGSVWNRIWQNTAAVRDTGWAPQTFDISALADNRPAVYIRWGIGPTNQKDHYSGWNIDDVEITGIGAVVFTPLAGDLEPDCDVDADDLTRLLSYWLAACGDCGGADLIADGIINLNDFQALADNWLAAP